MRYIYLFLTLSFLTLACQSNDTQQAQNELSEAFSKDQHIVSVLEVEQANQYTYLKVKENDEEYWMAVTRMDAEAGQTFYYGGRMEMTNFKSKDLDKTFDKIYFVQTISDKPLKAPAGMGSSAMGGSGRPDVAKQNVKIEPVTGGTTIADLFSKRENLSGQTVTVRGKVTKVNNGIMGRNWIHLQDGTSSGEKYDLTVTTSEQFRVGDVITLEGIVAVNKDFGAGYSYDLLIEQAKRINPEKM